MSLSIQYGGRRGECGFEVKLWLDSSDKAVRNHKQLMTEWLSQLAAVREFPPSGVGCLSALRWPLPLIAAFSVTISACPLTNIFQETINRCRLTTTKCRFSENHWNFIFFLLQKSTVWQQTTTVFLPLAFRRHFEINGAMLKRNWNKKNLLQTGGPYLVPYLLKLPSFYTIRKLIELSLNLIPSIEKNPVE